ncbi:SpaA isopeptide-forming pilin-related protein [Lacticaseibacillus hulanensis]|uniref:SpaA isopeptide-forming pilin-related protein n=1 Tax=Lacticaseibacillus hulanensis TaxID=2493111 RepID=UPI000FD88B14|nr:SpaA isopeptide-forming pilin-related protein [Lacticaseibacillus hulanensis]
MGKRHGVIGLVLLVALFIATLCCASTRATGLAAGNPEVSYTNNDQGVFPRDSWHIEDQQTVINPQGGDNRGMDGVTSWRGNADDREHAYLKFGDPSNPDFTIRKFARETSVPGTYDVYLNVRGNTRITSQTEPLDLVFVLDLSGSMEKDERGNQLPHELSTYRDSSGTYWWRIEANDIWRRHKRFPKDDVHLEAFIDRTGKQIFRNRDNHHEFFLRTDDNRYVQAANPHFVSDTSGGYIDDQTKAQALRAGLAGFMQALNEMAPEAKELIHVGAVTFSEPDYATNGQTVPLAPVSVSQADALQHVVAPTFAGGTFTQGGLKAGAEMLANQGRANSRQMMIVLSDGVPTYACHVQGVSTADGQLIATSCTNQIEGLGNTAGYSGTRYPNAVNGTHETDEYEVDGQMIASTWPATLGAAHTIQQQTDVRALGIQLGQDDGTGMTAKEVAAKYALIASKDAGGNRQVEFADSPGAVTDYLLRMAQLVESEIYATTIKDGRINDPLAPQFKMVSNNCDVQIMGNSALKPRVSLTSAGLSAAGITLGAGDELQLHYRVALRTQAPNFRTQYWYQFSSATTLMPNGRSPDELVNFGEPSARAPARELEVVKRWRIPLGARLPDKVRFTVQRRTPAAVDSTWKGYVTLTVADADDDHTWEREFTQATTSDGRELAMPAYSDAGVKLRYFVTAEDLRGYVQQIDNDVDWATREDDEAQITNTQRRLQIMKYEKNTQSRLAGAEFRLKKVRSWGDNLGTPITLTAVLLPGKYEVRETVAPEGFVLNKTTFRFAVSEDGTWLDEDGEKIDRTGPDVDGGGYASGFYQTGPAELVLLVNDEPNPEPRIMPHTGGTGRQTLALLATACAGIVALLIMYAVRNARGWRE